MRKSQKSFGQKKPDILAATWSAMGRVSWGFFGGEEGFCDGRGRRTGCGGEDDEAGPVVFDEFAHFDGC